jgi:hypothetical protein
MTPDVTPDGRYIVVEGRLWRASDPRLATDVREELVKQLMDARRAVRAALKTDDSSALTSARSSVQAAKEALGERGRPWWDDGAPDFNRRLIENSPYAEWWLGAGAEPLPSFTGEEGPIRAADGR